MQVRGWEARILKVGQLLTAATGTWSGSAPITYGYQWQLCNLLGEACGNIAGATGSTLLLGVLDLGLAVTVSSPRRTQPARCRRARKSRD
jgi:hypothetical protein